MAGTIGYQRRGERCEASLAHTNALVSGLSSSVEKVVSEVPRDPGGRPLGRVTVRFDVSPEAMISLSLGVDDAELLGQLFRDAARLGRSAQAAALAGAGPREPRGER